MRKFETFTHTNSKNETIDFVSLGIYINENDMRNFVWEYKTKNNKITKFKRTIVEKTIPFKFRVTDDSKAAEIKNKFFEHFEVDILTFSKGYFEINGYKFYCFCNKSSKSEYGRYQGFMTLELGIVTDNGFWIKENSISFNYDRNSDGDDDYNDGLNYPYNYPYNYSKGDITKYVDSDLLTTGDFRIIVYGYAVNPRITIGDKHYAVNVEVKDKECLVIDSQEKTIYKIQEDGSILKCYDKRVRPKELGNNIFDGIESGRNVVTWNRSFVFDVVLIDARSEPKWI